MNNLKSNEFYIFKVNFTDDVWRKVRVSSDIFLDLLSDVILDSFGFGLSLDYAFCMKNINWPMEKPIFWSPFIIGAEPTTASVKLKDLNFEEDACFGYLNSSLFGGWIFDVTFLKTVTGSNGSDIVLEAKGEVPEDIFNMWLHQENDI